MTATREHKGDRIFAAPADSRPLYFRDRKARHTCRITGKECDMAFRCRFSAAEKNVYESGPNSAASIRSRFEACDLANRCGFETISICKNTCPKRKTCKDTWKCWFYGQFKKERRA